MTARSHGNLGLLVMGCRCSTPQTPAHATVTPGFTRTRGGRERASSRRKRVARKRSVLRGRTVRTGGSELWHTQIGCSTAHHPRSSRVSSCRRGRSRFGHGRGGTTRHNMSVRNRRASGCVVHLAVHGVLPEPPRCLAAAQLSSAHTRARIGGSRQTSGCSSRHVTCEEKWIMRERVAFPEAIARGSGGQSTLSCLPHRFLPRLGWQARERGVG